jgi:hypothetical protein
MMQGLMGDGTMGGMMWDMGFFGSSCSELPRLRRNNDPAQGHRAVWVYSVKHCRRPALGRRCERSSIEASAAIELSCPSRRRDKEDVMTVTALMRMTALTTVVAAGVTSGAIAQTTTADPHHPSAKPAQGTSGQGQSQDAQPAQPGMMRPGMTGQGMMGQGRMGQGMMGGMPMMGGRGHMMKVMFAIADTDGDGALSFEEVTTIHKRIFTRVDANKDGKVTVEEVQAFMRE